ncbi:MAG: APC family permease [Chloroflexi bacterium]|nr:APC family permease [Chloroflexota bacterium]
MESEQPSKQDARTGASKGRGDVPASSPVHPDLEWREVVRGSRPGNDFVRIARHRAFRRIEPGLLVPRPEQEKPATGLVGLFRRVKRLLLGAPLATAQESLERVSKIKGLAVFASDNISSSAYATEEIMRMLALAGAAALALTMPITLAIVVVLAIVVISYLQVIRAYPGGGGGFSVTYENLGPLAGLVAAAALLTDYILTVAVSVSAGVSAITSAFPTLFEHRVLIGVAVVAVVTLLNLRGMREAGTIFAVPTYIYVATILGLLGYGLFRLVTGTLPPYEAPAGWAEAHAAEALTLLLVSRAFASGAVALTGTEAILDGVPAFKPPEVRNARITLVAMGTLFATIFIGFSVLSGQLGILPDPAEVQTVNSQVARVIVGTGWYFYLVQFATAIVLLLAANTAFAGFPRLASVLGKERFLPRTFQFRGDRLAFTAGIILLAGASSLLIVTFSGSVTNLIPLYTIGVFIAFTLSQAGLVRLWWQSRGRGRQWIWRAAINGLGATTTGVVAVVVAVSKFMLGAWMVLLALPVLIGLMWMVHRHYARLDKAAQAETPLRPEDVHPRIIVPIANLGVPARQALAFASALDRNRQAVAVHITEDAESAHAFRRSWEAEHLNVPLVVIESPFRSLVEPLLAYIEAVRESHPNDTVMVILPEFVPSHWWEHLLHNQTGLRLKAALLFYPGVVVANIPYHLPR